jgi:hypothetical protein
MAGGEPVVTLDLIERRDVPIGWENKISLLSAHAQEAVVQRVATQPRIEGRLVNGSN